MIVKNIKKSKLGITLIEILIYVGLLTTVLALVTNFLYQVANFRMLNQIQSSMLQNSQVVLNKIDQDVRKATEIITPSDNNFSNSLVLNTQAGQITYELENGILLKNNQALTDNYVVTFFNEGMGFRRIGHTIHLTIGIRSVVKPFGQPKKENIYKSAFFINPNDN